MQPATTPSAKAPTPSGLARLMDIRDKARVMAAALPTNRTYFTAAETQTPSKVAIGDTARP
jgi:tryptophan 7-halogenase